MNRVYVVYKNNKIYRTGSKNAVYLDSNKAKEVVLFHCKNDASFKFNKEHKYDFDSVVKFQNLSKNEQDKLIEKEKKNYIIRIFTDSGASL